MSDILIETTSMIELKQAPESLGHARLIDILKNLDRLFGKDQWQRLEMETISITLGFVLDDLTQDKINVLKIMQAHPDMFFDDPAFMLYATDVINNTVANFDAIPACTSLELAFAVEEVKELMAVFGQTVLYTPEITEAVAYILRHEGYSEPIGPFGFIPKEKLVPGQLPEDTAAKLKAINAYIYSMRA